MAEPNENDHFSLLAASAQGLTFSAAFRMKATSSISVQTFAELMKVGLCKKLNDYINGQGVVVAMTVDEANGNGSHRFQFDRATCTRGSDPSMSAASGQSRLASGPAPSTPGAQRCSAYVGQMVQSRSFAEAVAPFGKLTPKSEYETTAQFEARQAQAVGGATGPLIIEKAPESRDYFRYDADAQVLRIEPYVFDNVNFPTWDAFYFLGMDQQFGVSTGENIDVVISSRDRVTGSYKGQNSYGANATVQKITQSVEAIFERGPDPRSGRGELFPGAGDVGSISMTPEEARLLKPSLRIAFVVAPFAPYVLKGTNPFGRPSVRSPKDITVDFTILMADIQCGLVMDQQGRVLGAYSTS